MLTRKLLALTLAVSLALLTSCGYPLTSPAAGSAPASVPAAAPASARSFDHLPLYFVENRGQTDPRVAFYVPGRDQTLYFTPAGVTFAFTAPLTPTTAAPLPAKRAGGGAPGQAAQRWAVKLDFVGANPNIHPVGQSQTDAVFSYFKGKPDQWHTGLPTYGRLVYPDLWPGIDLVYYGTVNRLKYEFVVKSGADPRQIRLAYRGATSVQVNAVGQLAVTTPIGGFHDDTPVAYEDVDGRRVGVAIAYALDEGRDDPVDRLLAGAGDTPVGAGDAPPGRLYSFRVGDYDPTQPLVLDPAVLVYAGYIGGAGNDSGSGIAVDGAGNAYVTGSTTSDQTAGAFPVTGGPDLTYNGARDAFVAKVNAAGTALIYAGYIGGAGDDFGYGIAVDGAGNAYVTGQTYSDQTAGAFPVTVGPDPTYNGGSYDAFVAKVNAAGTALVYAGYIGGAGNDSGSGIAVDGAGNAYVTGSTTSDQTADAFPVAGGPDLTYNGGFYGDAFVAKVNAAGTALVYAGYLGGTGDDGGYGIAVDGAGNAYVTGNTTSDQTAGAFPVTGGPDLTFNGVRDAFVAKVNAAGTALVYAGYVGGAGDDYGEGIAVDGAGNAYVTGDTNSDQTAGAFPVTGGPDLTFNGVRDAFVAKVNAAGTALVYAGYLGGAGSDYGSGIAVDSAGNAYVTSYTTSDETTFPVTGGPDLIYNGNGDAFVAKVIEAGVCPKIYLPLIQRNP